MSQRSSPAPGFRWRRSRRMRRAESCCFPAARGRRKRRSPPCGSADRCLRSWHRSWPFDRKCSLAEGYPAAIEAVVRALRPRLAKMAAYYARCTGEDEDDLLQEAWLGLLQSLPELDLTIGRPEQYLIQRARWRLLDAVKRARVRRCLALD